MAVPLSCVAVWGQPVNAEDPATNHRQLLNRYCVGCHNNRTLTAGLSLQNLDVTQAGVEVEETDRK
ncbi:MAG: hypothetical protein VB674_00980, partial [Vicinamibacterales bacterium]